MPLLAVLCTIFTMQKKNIPHGKFKQRCIVFHPSFVLSPQQLFATLTFSDLPGLVVEEDFLSRDLHEKVFTEVLRSSNMANEMASLSNILAKVSLAHNIPIRSEYIEVKLPLEGQFGSSCEVNNSGTISAEHFRSYGQGHRLTYFRGNDNIPRLRLPSNFLDKLSVLNVIEQEVQKSRQRIGVKNPVHHKLKYRWRLTLNHYPSSGYNGRGRVGFPWHQDLEANGAATVILGLGSPGRIEFGKLSTLNLSLPSPKRNLVEQSEYVEPVRSVTLKPGSLLILTGPARWDFVHRVLPSSNGGERASLVYGIW